MRQTKTLIQLGLVLVVASVFAACTSRTMVKSDLGIKGAPDWVNKGTNILKDKNGRLFYGVGSAPAMGDQSLQISTADERARAEVARILSSYLDVVSHDYQSSTNSGEGATAEQAVSRSIKNLTQINLSGAKIIGRWRDPRTNTVYSIAELDMKHVKDTLRDVRDMNENFRRYLDQNGDNIFDRVATKQGE